jgi:hypothetical protein
MTIWLLAVLLLAALAGLGYRQGGVRVAFSLIGILAAALLANPVGKLIKMLMVMLGLKNILLLGILPPLIGFILISLCFKAGALPVHHKVDVHFKYHAGDLRLALWERLHHRLGLCLGLFNGVAYFIVISWVIYALSYWTVQMSNPSGDPWSIRLLNALGKDLSGSGFYKVARAVDPLPDSYYETANTAGVIYNNPLLEARLSHYPAFLSLAERPEFQELGNDKAFIDMWQRGEPLLNVASHPPVKKILENADLVKTIRGIVVPDLKDLQGYLLTGRSEKYDPQKILGKWDFDLAFTMVMVRRAKPNFTANEMLRQRREKATTYAQTSLVATPEHQAILKHAPQAGQGEWKEESDNKYQVTISGKSMTATIEGERLTLRGEGFELAFLRED